MLGVSPARDGLCTVSGVFLSLDTLAIAYLYSLLSGYLTAKAR